MTKGVGLTSHRGLQGFHLGLKSLGLTLASCVCALQRRDLGLQSCLVVTLAFTMQLFEIDLQLLELALAGIQLRQQFPVAGQEVLKLCPQQSVVLGGDALQLNALPVQGLALPAQRFHLRLGGADGRTDHLVRIVVQRQCLRCSFLVIVDVVIVIVVIAIVAVVPRRDRECAADYF